MRSSMFTAMALFVSVSLVSSRPQDPDLRIEDLAKEVSINSDANPDAMIIQPPSEFLPSSSDRIPNLAFVSPETPGAVPQTISEFNAALGSTGFSTDYTKTETLSYDGAFNIAHSTPSTWLTDTVKSYINSVISGKHKFVMFTVSGDNIKLVPYAVSTDNNWALFANMLRTSPPSFVLHSLKDGQMLFIHNYMYMPDDSAKKQDIFLEDIETPFYEFLQDHNPKIVYPREVYDFYSLQDAINTYNQAPAVICAHNQCTVE